VLSGGTIDPALLVEILGRAPAAGPASAE
jgi:hypothetical protein